MKCQVKGCEKEGIRVSQHETRRSKRLVALLLCEDHDILYDHRRHETEGTLTIVSPPGARPPAITEPALDICDACTDKRNKIYELHDYIEHQASVIDGLQAAIAALHNEYKDNPNP